MKPILQNLVEMTGHRDYLRLEVSVLSTLQQLSGILEARALEVFLLNGLRYTRPRTWMQDGQWTSTESEAAADPQRQLLDQLPDLQHCIKSAWPTPAPPSPKAAIRCGCRCGCTTKSAPA